MIENQRRACIMAKNQGRSKDFGGLIYFCDVF